jgi:hypothetical protein
MIKLAAILVVLAPALAIAADAGKSGAAPAVALKLIISKPVALECQTKSVVVAANAANATNGQLTLTLVLKDDAAKPATGSWRIAAVGSAHTGSLGQREAKACSESCPLRIAVDGNIELWSPSPKGVDQLAERERLLLAVVKADTLALRATTFSGKEIESLEEGTCRIGS